MWTNCLFFALIQLIKHGGYLLVRRSRWYPGPHFFWSPDLVTFVSVVPVRPRKRWLPPLWFKARKVTWTGSEPIW